MLARKSIAGPVEPLRVPPPLTRLPWDIAQSEFGVQGADFMGIMDTLLLHTTQSQFSSQVADSNESMLTAEWLEKEVFGLHAADAIFPLNWVCSLHVLCGLRELGKRPGREIPLISFDDFDLGDMLTPGLSVVRQPSEMLAREAARPLFERLNGSKGQRRRSVVLPAELIIRGSCGCR